MGRWCWAVFVVRGRGGDGVLVVWSGGDGEGDLE